MHPARLRLKNRRLVRLTAATAALAVTTLFTFHAATFGAAKPKAAAAAKPAAPAPAPTVTSIDVLAEDATRVLVPGTGAVAVARLNPGERIVLAAVVTGDVKEVDWRVNGGGEYTERKAPWTYGLQWPKVRGWAAPVGVHTVVATATDKAGRTGKPFTFLLTVRPPLDLPGLADVMGDAAVPLPAGCVRVFVARDGSSDYHDGLSPSRPLANVAAALKVNKGNVRLMLRNGTPVKGGFVAPAGGVYCYGDPAKGKPVIWGPTAKGASAVAVKRSGVVIYGVHIESADSDPAVAGFNANRGRNYGVSIAAGVDRTRVERSVVRLFGANVQLNGDERPGGKRVTNVDLVDTVLADAWGPDDWPEWDRFTGHAVYGVGYDDVRLLRVLLDNNGWTPETLYQSARAGNGFRHAFYGNYQNAEPFEVVDCVVSRSGSYGLQPRAGANVLRTIFYDNGTHLGISGADPLVEGCAFLGGHTYAAIEKGAKPGDKPRRLDQSVGVWNSSLRLRLTDCVFDGVDVPFSTMRRTWTPAGTQTFRGERNVFIGCYAGPVGDTKGKECWTTAKATARHAALKAEVAKRLPGWRKSWDGRGAIELLGAEGK